jgi:hypothetical protein
MDSDTAFQQGQILCLSIAAPLQYLEANDVSHLRATGEVIRFDPPDPSRPLCGVALNFLEGPTFCANDLQKMFQISN